MIHLSGILFLSIEIILTSTYILSVAKASCRFISSQKNWTNLANEHAVTIRNVHRTSVEIRKLEETKTSSSIRSSNEDVLWQFILTHILVLVLWKPVRVGPNRHETKHEVFDSVPAAVSKILGDLEIFSGICSSEGWRSVWTIIPYVL